MDITEPILQQEEFIMINSGEKIYSKVLVENDSPFQTQEAKRERVLPLEPLPITGVLISKLNELKQLEELNQSL